MDLLTRFVASNAASDGFEAGYNACIHGVETVNPYEGVEYQEWEDGYARGFQSALFEEDEQF